MTWINLCEEFLIDLIENYLQDHAELIQHPLPVTAQSRLNIQGVHTLKSKLFSAQKEKKEGLIISWVPWSRFSDGLDSSPDCRPHPD